MIDRRAFVAVAGLAFALPALATPRRSIAPVRATRTGLLYDNRYYGFPDDADGGDLVFAIGQNSTWHYHAFPDDTEGVLRHVPTGLTFLTVPVPRNEPPEVELLHLGSAPAVDNARLTMIGYAAQTSAMTGFLESLYGSPPSFAARATSVLFPVFGRGTGRRRRKPTMDNPTVVRHGFETRGCACSGGQG